MSATPRVARRQVRRGASDKPHPDPLGLAADPSPDLLTAGRRPAMADTHPDSRVVRRFQQVIGLLRASPNPCASVFDGRPVSSATSVVSVSDSPSREAMN